MGLLGCGFVARRSVGCLVSASLWSSCFKVLESFQNLKHWQSISSQAVRRNPAVEPGLCWWLSTGLLGRWVSLEVAGAPAWEGGPQTSTMTECFDCDNCKESLYGRKYIQMDNGPYCIPCYDAHFANTCDECKELIGHDCRELYYEDRHYHEHCFRCFRCDRSLADEPFTCQGEELLCNDCYCSEFSSKCVACEKTVMPGSRKLEYNGQTWHEHCFICSSCQQPIGSRSFIPDQKDYYCVPCYENKFAPRCTRCKKTLTKGGVTYRDEPWHKECFVCTGCKTPLAGQQFTSQDDNPYCIKCFGNLYAKKCSACTKPITGFGGGKYVSFEDRHWHHNCFNCARCNTSLVGKGFIPDNDEILCRDCSSDL
ncbi:four and a half LIM domains protein 3 isoform X1 [Phaenicophaeus curvirostris]|uniref:four and a half LIM domains protein 3 isoform X1 n=2 Tax=Phaenicophaeus curvirostris TaxID=33595 RepID=UPI0037F0E3EF